MLIKENLNYNGCLMLDLVPDNNHTILLNAIPQDYLFVDDNSDNYGLRVHPHITILYGLNDDTDHNLLQIHPLSLVTLPNKIKLGNLSLFECEDYDVLKLEPINEQDISLLNLLNKEVREVFDYNNDYPDYVPHCTVAYLKKGMGAKFLEECNYLVTNLDFTMTTLRYSYSIDHYYVRLYSARVDHSVKLKASI